MGSPIQNHISSLLNWTSNLADRDQRFSIHNMGILTSFLKDSFQDEVKYWLLSK